MRDVTLYLVLLTALALPLGGYIHAVIEYPAPPLARLLRPMETAIYRSCGIDPMAPMDWTSYTSKLILFNGLGALLLYALQRLQAWLPLNPAHFSAVAPHTAFNTAVSFVTNTSWQAYAGESTLSQLVQMCGIAVQSFLSGATGLCVLMALLRGFRSAAGTDIGNVWRDLTRATLYVLLPLSALLSLLLIGQGCIQNLDDNKTAATLERLTYQSPKIDTAGNPIKDAAGNPVTESVTTQSQILPMGPVASQTAIALLSGDGGGYFNANSAHPYANPTPLSNLLEMIAILLIPAALCHTFGIAVGDRRQGWAVYAAMTLLLATASVLAMHFETAGNPDVQALRVDQGPALGQAGGNMEGKETRFGIAASSLFATVTTGGGDGAVNSTFDSYSPLGGSMPMILIQLGEVVFGGPGSGLYGMLIYAIIAVFIASLMIGRAPEYLGKSIEPYEVKMASIVILVAPFLILLGTAVSALCDAGRSAAGNPGAHAFSEVLYAFSSAANNNGSAFAGLSANTPYYNIMLGIAMWFGRFAPIVAVMAIAGSLSTKRRRPPGPGTLPTHGAQFVVLLLGTLLLVGALTFVPALAMGPMIEQLQASWPH